MINGRTSEDMNRSHLFFWRVPALSRRNMDRRIMKKGGERDQRQHRGETVKVEEGSTGHERDEDAHNWCPSRDLRVILRPSVCG